MQDKTKLTIDGYSKNFSCYTDKFMNHSSYAMHVIDFAGLFEYWMWACHPLHKYIQIHEILKAFCVFVGRIYAKCSPVAGFYYLTCLLDRVQFIILVGGLFYFINYRKDIHLVINSSYLYAVLQID
jgi:hypothetical protein